MNNTVIICTCDCIELEFGYVVTYCLMLVDCKYNERFNRTQLSHIQTDRLTSQKQTKNIPIASKCTHLVAHSMSIASLWRMYYMCCATMCFVFCFFLYRIVSYGIVSYRFVVVVIFATTAHFVLFSIFFSEVFVMVCLFNLVLLWIHLLRIVCFLSCILLHVLNLLYDTSMHSRMCIFMYTFILYTVRYVELRFQLRIRSSQQNVRLNSYKIPNNITVEFRFDDAILWNNGRNICVTLRFLDCFHV